MPDELHISGIDRLPITATREKTKEGYLKATAAITCVGVQEYTDRQLGGNTDRIVGVYRSRDVVFHPETIKSAKLKPLTHDHPDMDVTAINYKDLVIGNLGETVEALDDKRLGASVIVNDADAVDKVERGLVETSAGYDAVLVKESGSFEGRDYEYVFKGPMIINHLAVVDAGRCGPTVKILDKKGSTMNEEELKKFLTDAGILDKDGKPVVAQDSKDKNTDNSEAIVSKLFDALPELVEKIAQSLTDDEDEEGEDDDEAEDEGEEGLDDEAVRDAAAKRTALIVDAQPLLGEDDDVHKMTDREILETALKDVVGEKEIEEKSDEYLQGVLDSITKDRKEAGDSYPLKSNKDKAGSNGEIGGPISGLAARKLQKKG